MKVIYMSYKSKMMNSDDSLINMNPKLIS